MIKLASQVLSALALTVALWSGAADAQTFTCGPYATTYVVYDSYGNVTGVRCVKALSGQVFSWYGEGRWGSLTYRHVGYASGDIFNGGVNFTGMSGDITGNGEVANSFYNNLSIHTSLPITQSPGLIQVRGALYEDWYRASNNAATYTMLPYDIRSCGQNLEQMWVPDMTGALHIRCLLNPGRGTNLPYAWVGKGAHSGKPYLHLGMGNFAIGGGWATSDLCVTNNHYCGYVPQGGLNLSRLSDTSILVSGAWGEHWMRF